MKGIYLTEEGKREIEAKITTLQSQRLLELKDDFYDTLYMGQIKLLEEILSSATILQ